MKSKIWKYFLFITVCVTVCIVNFSCTSETFGWITTDESAKIWCGLQDTTYQYSWTGETFDSVAHGKGVLKIYDEGNVVSESGTNAVYGSLCAEDIVKVADNEYYIGAVSDNLFQGFGVYKKDKDLYIGSFKDSKPDGFLKWYTADKLHYSGMWKEGNFNGEGTLYKEDGKIRTGEWENGNLTQALVEQEVKEGHYKGYVKKGRPDGIGKMAYAKGGDYSGYWKNGKWNGEGVYTVGTDTIVGTWEKGKLTGDVIYKTDKLFYEGSFVDNMPTGIGNLTVVDNSYYTGNWVDGKRAGLGEIYFANGDSYSGEWEDNTFHGTGRYVYASENAVYNGDWEKGLHNGVGEYTSPKFSYQGNWEKGWMEGEGRITFENGDVYDGTFHENLLDGIGTYRYSNGNFYEGEFVEGRMTGLGVFHFKKGDVFEGEFVNGKIYGDGTLYLVDKNKDVTIITGFWDIDGSFPKNVSIVFPDGDMYEGPFQNGQLSEEGQWTTAKERQQKIDKINNSTAHKFNELYKKHRETINWCIIGVSGVVTAVEVAAVATGVGAPVAAVAHGVNMAINVVDAGMAVASAAIDYQEAATMGEDTSDAAKNLALEVSVNLASVAIPKVMSKALKPLGKPLKGVVRSAAAGMGMIAKKSALKFTKGKIFGRIVKISAVKLRNGVRKVEKTLVRNEHTQKPTIAGMRLLTGRKSQYVSLKAFQKILKKNPELKKSMRMSAEGSSKNLGRNMRMMGTNKFVKLNERIKRYLRLPKLQIEPHHIIPSNPQTASGRQARNIWVKYFGSVDHPLNGIWLGRNGKKGYYGIAKGTNHVSNTKEYEEEVAKIVIATYKKYGKKYAKNPEMMQKVLAEAVDQLKDQLYRGKLQIGKEKIVHTSWSIFKQPVAGVAKEVKQMVRRVSLAIQ